ncbi:serine/arginine repetitive matrix protein 2 [Drosophila eugracilis]|uniref:serine/arginine repetitive matrix protein 2 n=1 Tax=Drosophila eugracilis TaxID=29029 RepID=UPI0007E73B8D|nr:serine/arginine repetitive matrix protein 2 [Drosophila eugracilis]
MNTGISLNDRFTQMQSKPLPQGRGRSRSRSRSRRIVDSGAGNAGISAANSRLLQEFKRRHTVQTALKLKRRSLRTNGVTGRGVRVGGVKSLRLAPNGKPMRSNNVTRVATMRADLVASSNVARNRRSGSSTRRFSVSNGAGGGGLRQRLGQRRPSVGGAAERVERRQRQQQQQSPRGRSRSRSRSRQPQPQRVDGRRSQSRGRSVGRSQSRNRDRSAQGRVPVKQRLSVKHRLGIRPGQGNNHGNNQAKNPRQRRASSQLRGVVGGRVEKRRTAQVSPKKGVSASLAGRQGRPRGRSAVRNAAAGGGVANNSVPGRRSRSRNRAAVVAAAAANATAKGRANPRQRRGRSAGAPKGSNNNSNGKTNKYAKGKTANGGKQGPQQQGRRGRSRSRKPAGKSQPVEVKREDLDMELDQYMSTTKSEMDYLLK